MSIGMAEEAQKKNRKRVAEVRELLGIDGRSMVICLSTR